MGAAKVLLVVLAVMVAVPNLAEGRSPPQCQYTNCAAVLCPAVYCANAYTPPCGCCDICPPQKYGGGYRPRG
uniref:Paralithocin 2 n=1 Tax=Paralithodes camtschaticus TaxID=6741 RepID=AMP2_PARCM|nr:RecName: Full=Paralithocin 2; AltName: Full=P30; Flags: Precursor [Paralithodes camtschaticus]AUT12058.1 paralithocin 2 [Paralithodes camtschaticus]